MKTCGEWLLFNYEYLMWFERLTKGETPEDLIPEIREWARSWFRTEGEMDMLRKSGYRRSWYNRVEELLGEKEATKLMMEMIMK